MCIIIVYFFEKEKINAITLIQSKVKKQYKKKKNGVEIICYH